MSHGSPKPADKSKPIIKNTEETSSNLMSCLENMDNPDDEEEAE